MNIVMVAVFLPLRNMILRIATDDADVLSLGETLIPAMLVGTYLNLIVSNITSGVFSGMGRPIIATILSFGLELPMSIGGVALYIIKFHGDLIGVYWWQALSGGFEAAVVILIMSASNWNKCAIDARRRQELPTDDAEAEPSVLGMEESDDEQRSQQPSDSLAIISEESVGLIANNDINGTNEEQSQN
jgi:MATE family multidrug resistance protein